MQVQCYNKFKKSPDLQEQDVLMGRKKPSEALPAAVSGVDGAPPAALPADIGAFVFFGG